MIQISADQLQRLEADVWNRFEAHAVSDFREALGEAAAMHSDDELRAVLRQSRDRCAAFEVDTDAEILAYAEIALALGSPNFIDDEEHQWARVILQNRFLAPEERASRLLEIGRSFDDE